jgi:hypothetical protein
MFIFRLADMFYEITGEEPECKHVTTENTYVGDFFNFVGACLRPLESESRDALGKTTQVHLSEWRKARDLKA